ncbi:unnamed protein product [Dibothriocephalus latus]|uniref:Reverse transcriptase domain-containing protein n=1 Tax=Dibothriocephalus latus TaxID=60516 RepID=A0A3P7NPQ2_DIBLA|nr:unnamed protein product [Dibothriocephalus latus]
MHPPLGPILANIFMDKLEKLQLSEQIYELKQYGRYFDDACAIIPAETDENTIVSTAYQPHPSIKFILELGTTGSLLSLDVRRRVYPKKTWSGQYTNLNRFVHIQQTRIAEHAQSCPKMMLILKLRPI